jgi:PPOX class probable FMN-dependent enzyme
MNRFQDEFGVPSERARNKLVARLDDYMMQFIRHSPFAVLATADRDGHCDASPRGGLPGFVKILDDKQLLLPDVRGNKLFQSYQNIEGNRHVGLVFFIPGLERTVRVNGAATVIDRAGLAERGVDRLEIFDPDELAALLQGLLVEVEEAYGHCSRSLSFSRLWDPETIQHNREDPPVRK